MCYNISNINCSFGNYNIEKSHLESDDSILKKIRTNVQLTLIKLKTAELLLVEKYIECRKVSCIFRRIRFIRKRKDHLDQLSYRNVWEVV